MPENGIAQESQEVKIKENTNTLYIKSGQTNVKIVEHFSGDQTYEDIIKAALRREFSD